MKEKVCHKYRRGVGAMIVNKNNQVFVARRIDTLSGFQMPQGGFETEEDAEVCLYRELKEEVGTTKFSILYRLPYFLYYDFPHALQVKIYRGDYLGQSIQWFLLRFEGEDTDIDLQGPQPEFCDWLWTDYKTLVDNVVAFKKTMYQIVTSEFAKHLSCKV